MEHRSQIPSARQLIDRGYYQVSRKYRSVARLTKDGLPEEDSIELDLATFDEFRALGGVTWSEGLHRHRRHRLQAQFIDLLGQIQVSPADVLSEKLTMRELFVRLGLPVDMEPGDASTSESTG